MPENATQPTSPRKPESDAGHIPMSEEMDSARWTLPPIIPVAIGLVIVAVVIGIVLVGGRAKAGATATITGVHAVDKKSQVGVLALVQVHISNIGDKPMWIKGATVTIETDQGKWTDDAASASDFKRYFDAYPELKPYEKPALAAESKIGPGSEVDGMLLVGYPPPPEPNAATAQPAFTAADFDKRKSLTVTVDLYDRRPLEIKEKH
jgi:hypothetical protein